MPWRKTIFNEELKKHSAYLLIVTEIYGKTNLRYTSKYFCYLFIEGYQRQNVQPLGTVYKLKICKKWLKAYNHLQDKYIERDLYCRNNYLPLTHSQLPKVITILISTTLNLFSSVYKNGIIQYELLCVYFQIDFFGHYYDFGFIHFVTL